MDTTDEVFNQPVREVLKFNAPGLEAAELLQLGGGLHGTPWANHECPAIGARLSAHWLAARILAASLPGHSPPIRRSATIPTFRSLS